MITCIVDVKYLFLVGGFAESPILQQEVRHEFGHLAKLVIPQDVSLTILKGKFHQGICNNKAKRGFCLLAQATKPSET